MGKSSQLTERIMGSWRECHLKERGRLGPYLTVHIYRVSMMCWALFELLLGQCELLCHMDSLIAESLD